MLLYILLDLNILAWEIDKTGEDPLNNLLVFVNAFLLTKKENAVRIVNNKKVIYDSTRNMDFESIFEYLSIVEMGNSVDRREICHSSKNNPVDTPTNTQEDTNHPNNTNAPIYSKLRISPKDNTNAPIYSKLRISPKDLGFCLMDNPNAILIYEMSNEEPSEYLNYLKCMFVAQKRGVVINGYTLRNNMLVRMCAEGSGGRYLEDCSLRSLLGLMGFQKNKGESYEISCLCCNKHVQEAQVCPICLAVYCKFMPVCRRCKTKFNFPK